MTDKEVCVRNRSKRSFFGFSEDRFIVFLTFALFLICQNSLAVDDEGSNRPDCIAKLISDIGDRKSHGLAEIQSSLLTDVTLEEVKALLNGRVSVYVRIVEENSWASQFGFLEFTSTGGEFNLFGGSLPIIPTLRNLPSWKYLILPCTP